MTGVKEICTQIWIMTPKAHNTSRGESQQHSQYNSHVTQMILYVKSHPHHTCCGQVEAILFLLQASSPGLLWFHNLIAAGWHSFLVTRSGGVHVTHTARGARRLMGNVPG